MKAQDKILHQQNVDLWPEYLDIQHAVANQLGIVENSQALEQLSECLTKQTGYEVYSH